MKLDCRRCGSSIPVPPEATLAPEATVVCPGCGARYVRRGSRSSTLATVGGSAAAPASSPPTASAAGAGVPEAARAVSAISHPTVAMAAAESTQFRPGDVVGGRYRIRRFIARGGMGEVYEAEDAELRQTVALKTVHPRDAGQAIAVERFKREIHLARRVTHPNVCRIYDVGYHASASGEPIIFLSMELLVGETLAQLLTRRGSIPPTEMEPIARQMVEALAAAHAAGVVHRDFKCENVFLVPAPEGTRVVVTDFGVARGVDSDEFAANVTVADVAVGTPAYMAPEQIEGGAITAAVDQYALGVVLFEAVTGRLPFAGETPIATAVKRLTHAAPAADELMPGLDPRWVATLRRCLARNPGDRFASVREISEALRGNEGLVAAVATPAPPVAAASPRRNRRQLLLLGAVSLLLLLAVAQAVFRVRRSLASPFAGLSGVERRAVAVVPFRNLAQRPEFEWLSVALAEMVASEIRTTKGLRALAGDAVARAGVDLDLRTDEALQTDALERLRHRLGADFVVAGTYAVLGGEGATTVRLAVRVEDSLRGGTLGEAIETGAESELFLLVEKVGQRLRELLGSNGARPDLGVEAVAPKSPRAAKLYSEGLIELRAFELPAALESLRAAREAEPRNPMIRAALASTWAALGFENNARAEAEEALAMSSGLPPEERFAIEGLAWELRRDWARAEAIWAELWRAFPDDLDYGLKLANAQLEARRTDLALATVAALRELPEPDRESPRIELLEAVAASALSDFSRQRDAARRAAEKAETIRAPLLVAEGRVREAEALVKLGEPAAAVEACNAARELYRAAGDRVGEATALTVAAGALYERGELAAARTANESALSSYREAGDRNGVARTLNGLAVLARNVGEPARARELYAEAISVLDEVGDRRGIAYMRGNVAAVSAEEGRFREGRAAADEALSVLRELGDRSGVADSLLNLGQLDRRLGALDGAKAHLDEALALQRALGLKPGEAATLTALGAILLDRGDLPGARSTFSSAARLASDVDGRSTGANAAAGEGEAAFEAGDEAAARALLERALELRAGLGRAGKVDETRLILARIDLDSGEPRRALTAVESLLAEERGFRPPELATQIALVQSRALARLGRSSEARAAFERATELAATSESPQTGLQLLVAGLTLELAGARLPSASDDAVSSAVESARARGFEPLALELEILDARRELRSSTAAARARLEELGRAARALGLARLERLAVTGS